MRRADGFDQCFEQPGVNAFDDFPGPAYADESGYLRFHFGQLRRKLETDPARPRHLITEPGIGYRFAE